MKTNLHSMNLRCFSLPLTALLIFGALAGCGKPGNSNQKASPPANLQPPAAEGILKTWEQGDSTGAVQQFVEADWSARPLFSPGSPMNLSESEFKALSAVQREAESAEVVERLAVLKKVARAVTQAGHDAAAKKDMALARKHFTALDQFGGALDEPNSMLIVKLVGQALKKLAAAETAKLPQ